MKGPFVSCIMPTLKERDAYRVYALDSYDMQTYKAKAIYDYIADEDTTIGEMRNICIRESCGSLIAHWDDDDWSHPNRLERSVLLLREHGCVGTSTIYYRKPETKEAWLYDGLEDNFIPGGTFVYWRNLWEQLNFNPYLQYGEDTEWQKKISIFDMRDPSLYVATIHEGNTCKKHTSGRQWTPVDYDLVDKLIEDNS